MRAGILAVGSELLDGDRLDTNSLTLTRVLQRHGVALGRKAVVGDSEADIAAELSRMAADLDLILVTGGLGPTMDDRTREATAMALGRPLYHDPELLCEIRARFESRGFAMPESNARQADVIDGAEVLRNMRGTAPGMRISQQDVTVFLFPGVPAELEGLVRSDLEPWLAQHSPGVELETRVLRVACMSESALQDRLNPALSAIDPGAVTILASPGDIQLRLRAVGDETSRRASLDEMERSIRELVGIAAYATGDDASLESTLGDLLRTGRLTVATAESCTAGLVAERLTRVAGSSAYFVGGVVVYSNRLKQELLGVSAASLEEHGAVSREVALEMASGAVERLGSDTSIAITGVAGPGGGTDAKPVGTVHVAVARRGEEPLHRQLDLPGNRGRVRRLASQWALDLLRRSLIGRAGAV